MGQNGFYPEGTMSAADFPKPDRLLGDINQAHQPDEYLALGRIQPTMTLPSQLIRQFCL